MTLRHYAHRLKNRISLLIVKLSEPHKEKFECPVCDYSSPFMDVAPPLASESTRNAQTAMPLKALATQLHGLAVKSVTGKKPAQNRAIERIGTFLNQAIDAEVKQVYAGMASHVRGLAEKLEPSPKPIFYS
jgi:hypothetical protein